MQMYALIFSAYDCVCHGWWVVGLLPTPVAPYGAVASWGACRHATFAGLGYWKSCRSHRAADVDSLPYLACPNIALPYLTLPYLTLHHLNLTLPYPTLLYLSFPCFTAPYIYQTLPCLTLPCHTLLYLTTPRFKSSDLSLPHRVSPHIALS